MFSWPTLKPTPPPRPKSALGPPRIVEKLGKDGYLIVQDHTLQTPWCADVYTTVVKTCDTWEDALQALRELNRVG